MSGSAALPEIVFEQWKELTGFEILEQYGMSGKPRVFFSKMKLYDVYCSI